MYLPASEGRTMEKPKEYWNRSYMTELREVWIWVGGGVWQDVQNAQVSTFRVTDHSLFINVFFQSLRGFLRWASLYRK